MAFLKEAVETVAALQSPIEREIYGNKAAAAAGISAGAFAQEVERFRKNRAWQARKKQARRELTPAARSGSCDTTTSAPPGRRRGW